MSNKHDRLCHPEYFINGFGKTSNWQLMEALTFDYHKYVILICKLRWIPHLAMPRDISVISTSPTLTAHIDHLS